MPKRIDVLLVEKALYPSREKAQAAIMAGIVYVAGQKVDKAGTSIKDADFENVEIRGESLKYVSRGGLKLEKAIRDFDLKLDGSVCMDIGASTGGFTDCMLQNGAVKVFSVDVGYGQLDWKLRTDERVVNMERTNIRHVTTEQLDAQLDFASIDVSFISLGLVLPVLKTLMRSGGHTVFLIKPQFEAGREKVGKNGVVREAATHIQVLERVLNIARGLGFQPLDLTFSPIKGPKGNIEFLCHAVLGEIQEEVTDGFNHGYVSDLVKCAHETLKNVTETP